MTTPESLCGWVLKGKYYNNDDFMSATKKKHASREANRKRVYFLEKMKKNLKNHVSRLKAVSYFIT
jgi:hypothetical protein